MLITYLTKMIFKYIFFASNVLIYYFVQTGVRLSTLHFNLFLATLYLFDSDSTIQFTDSVMDER